MLSWTTVEVRVLKIYNAPYFDMIHQILLLINRASAFQGEQMGHHWNEFEPISIYCFKIQNIIEAIPEISVSALAKEELGIMLYDDTDCIEEWM